MLRQGAFHSTNNNSVHMARTITYFHNMYFSIICKISISNSQIWGSQIINHSHHLVGDVDRRFGVAYGENTDETRKVINKVLDNHTHILKDPAPFVEVEIFKFPFRILRLF